MSAVQRQVSVDFCWAVSCLLI